MNRMFHKYLGVFVLVYLDDILVFSKTGEEHLEHLETVLKLLRENKFYAKESKCDFNKPELRFLGHIVGRNGLRVDDTKLAVIKEWATPRDVGQLRSFLGLSNYFRRFVMGYSSMVAPLTALTGQKAPWNWGTAQQRAFNRVKKALVNPPVLVLPDFTLPFELISDASLAGTGAVLVQQGRPVAYTSKKFGPAEKNYTTGEQELLGVYTALKEWRCYLEGGVSCRGLSLPWSVAPREQEQLEPELSLWSSCLSQQCWRAKAPARARVT